MKVVKMPTPSRRTTADRDSAVSSGSPPRLPIQLCLTVNGDSRGQGVPGGEHSQCREQLVHSTDTCRGLGGTLSPERLEHGEEERRRAGQGGGGTGVKWGLERDVGPCAFTQSEMGSPCRGLSEEGHGLT